MALVVIGLPNKQVGGELGISEITVKAHRGSMMRKMKAESLAELVSIAARLRLPRPAGSAMPSAQISLERTHRAVTRFSSPMGPIKPARRYRSIPLSDIAQVYITVLITSLVACRAHRRLKRLHRCGLFPAGMNRGSLAQSWALSPDRFDGWKCGDVHGFILERRQLHYRHLLQHWCSTRRSLCAPYGCFSSPAVGRVQRGNHAGSTPIGPLSSLPRSHHAFFWLMRRGRCTNCTSRCCDPFQPAWKL